MHSPMSKHSSSPYQAYCCVRYHSSSSRKHIISYLDMEFLLTVSIVYYLLTVMVRPTRPCETIDPVGLCEYLYRDSSEPTR